MANLKDADEAKQVIKEITELLKSEGYKIFENQLNWLLDYKFIELQKQKEPTEIMKHVGYIAQLAETKNLGKRILAECENFLQNDKISPINGVKN